MSKIWWMWLSAVHIWTVLRVQSARGWRRGNLVDVRLRDCGFENAVQELQDIPFIKIMTTKIGNLSASSAARAQIKSHLTITDKITNYLFRAWYELVPADLPDDSFIFPNCGQDSFEWDKAFPWDQHKTACLAQLQTHVVAHVFCCYKINSCFSIFIKPL